MNSSQNRHNVLLVLMIILLVIISSGFSFVFGRRFEMYVQEQVGTQISQAIATRIAAQPTTVPTSAPTPAPLRANYITGQISADYVQLREGAGDEYDITHQAGKPIPQSYQDDPLVLQGGTVVNVYAAKVVGNVVWVKLYAPRAGLIPDGWTIANFVNFDDSRFDDPTYLAVQLGSKE